MFNGEEYILDIKVEEDKTMEIVNNCILSPVYQIEDINSNCTTITATEIECEQKKLRVLIKKLPQTVLDKYFPKNCTKQTMKPSRTSKRVKILPAKYRFLNRNKTTHKSATKHMHNFVPKTRKSPTYKHRDSTGISKTSITISKPKMDKIPHQIKSINKTHLNDTHNANINNNNNVSTVTVESSKILVIKQPVLKNDPLNIPTTRIEENNDLEMSNSNLEKEIQTNPEEQTETDDRSEIVERIYFSNKSVQTKFTCNGSICGLVDSDEFNLNCFYCYEIFPLHKWLEFKDHLKIQHHVNEKQQLKQAPEPKIIIDDVQQPVVNIKSILKNLDHFNIQHHVKENQNLKQSPPQQIIINDVVQEPVVNNKPLLNNQKMDEIIVLKPTQDPNRKTAWWRSKSYNTKEKFPLKHLAMSSSSLKKPLLKNPACYINLEEFRNKPTTSTTTKNNLNESEEFIDITSDIRDRDSCAEDIISIGDDEEEDNEFDEIIENFSKEFMAKDGNNAKTLNSPTHKLQTLNNSTINIPAPSTAISPQLILANLPHLTVRKLGTVNTPTVAVETPQTQGALKKAYIKLPTNLSIEEVLKTIPKPTIAQQSSAPLNSTKPRYFVVKKVVRPMPTENVSNISLPMETIMTELPTLKENDNDDDDMPSNDENEDEVPKATNGCGILFGLTHRDVVLQFLLKLKTFPELWRPQVKHDNNVNYDQSIEELCKHLNERFDLNIEDFEMRLSIQRVKDWYCRMLKNIFLHNQNRNNVEPYKHTFPEYFKILNKFLTSDVHYAKNLLLSKSYKSSNTSMNDYPKWMVYKPGRTMHKMATKTPLEKPRIPPKGEKSPKKPIIKFKATTLPDDDASQNVIEFDADTLYGNESSDDENIKPLKNPKPRRIAIEHMELKPKRTKVYCPMVPIVCDICDRNFKRNIDLRRHRVGHFPPKFQCSLCSQMFLHKHWAEKCSHDMKKKQSTLTNEANDDGLIIVTPTKVKSRVPKLPNFRKWICEMCGVSYRSVGSLNAHKRDKHLNQRLKCVVCKFTAVTNYRIVQHQKKRHVVEPGTVEEVAKKCRARLDSKTPFTPEARQEFDWRREQRKKLSPGELFYGCCKCRIIFKTRKEKVLHNKLEHPIKDTTVICLLCHPEKMLLSNSNSVRRHYTDIHKVPWDEIDDLVKRTKPIFQLLSKDEIEILNSSVNYNELLTELLITKKLRLEPEPESIKEEATRAVEVLANVTNYSNEIEVAVRNVEELDGHVDVSMESCHETEENVFVDGIIDHDYNNADEENYRYEHNYNENENQNYNHHYQADDSNDDKNNNEDQENVNVHNDTDSILHTQFQIISVNNDDGSNLSIGELVEESIVVEEFVDDDFIEEDTIEDYF